MLTFMKSILLSFGVVVVLAGCRVTEPTQGELLSIALAGAGPNRPELEQTLDHYATEAPDSTRLAAALYLVANMPGHYTTHSTEDSLFLSKIPELAVLSDPYGWDSHLSTTVRWADSIRAAVPARYGGSSDPKHITADYLIAGIDDAYHTWNQTPWRDKYTFDEFCEWVLPYRVNNERLEMWRPMAREAVTVPDSVQATGDPVAIARYLITHTGIHFNIGMEYWPLPLSFLDMWQIKRGECYEMSFYALKLMRAYGIPSAADAIPAWANRSQAHMWNAVILPGGKSVDVGYNPNGKNIIVYKISKIYRRRFSPMRDDVLYRYKDFEPLPRFFENCDRMDVTAAYDMPVSDAIVKGLTPSGHKLVWLATFDNRKWIPVAYAEKKGNKATFKDLARGILPGDNKPIAYENAGEGILYLPGYFNGGRVVPAAAPFILHENGTVRTLTADTVRRQTLTLSRKYPKNPDFAHYERGMVGGRFEGANRADFSDAVTLLEVTKPQAYPMEESAVVTSGTYRYVRYVAPECSSGNVAEVQFRSEGRTLTGQPMGTRGIVPRYYPASLFDGDMETYFEVQHPQGEVWAGLDLGTPQPVTSIAFAARTDDNDVRPGDTYELSYWMPDGWRSAGTQVADSYHLTWADIPSGTVYLLRNLSRGVEQRPFTYENGLQVWW